MRGYFALQSEDKYSIKAEDPLVEKLDFSPSNPAYMNEFRESDIVEWRPYVYWKRRPYTGRYINVDLQGLRRTHNLTTSEEAGINVFVFGGSAVWGPWVRDEYTIPSVISRLLYEKGYHNVLVTNFGESGYVSTQEVIQLELELRHGTIPDIVVFYDGVNDVFSTLQNETPGIPLNEEHRVLEFNAQKEPDLLRTVTSFSVLVRSLSNLTYKIRSSPQEPQGKHENGDSENELMQASYDSLAKATIRTYLANVDLVEAMAKRYDFEAYFFWQPCVFSRSGLTAEEQEISSSFNQSLAEFYQRVYSLVPGVTRQVSDVIDLQSSLDTYAGPAFIDYCHVYERANQVIGGAITDSLLTRSTRLGQSGPLLTGMHETAQMERGFDRAIH